MCGNDEVDEDVDMEPPASAIKSTAEAINLVNDLKKFASAQL